MLEGPTSIGGVGGEATGRKGWIGLNANPSGNGGSGGNIPGGGGGTGTGLTKGRALISGGDTGTYLDSRVEESEAE